MPDQTDKDPTKKAGFDFFGAAALVEDLGAADLHQCAKTIYNFL
ncbi:hypothetical protein [Bacillus sp. V2I10]|nr:hypothetical protein [Bacillus sp. V2I10]MDQ0857096.1 hypothetical protein [Bacillus sp. V2I10]